MWHPSCCELLQPQTMAAANTCPTADSCGLNWDAAAAELGVERPEAKRGSRCSSLWSRAALRALIGARHSRDCRWLPFAGPTPYCARNVTLPMAQG